MVQIIRIIALSPIAPDQVVGATGILGFAADVEWLLTAFVIVSLSLSVALFFWVSAEHRRSEQNLKDKLNDSMTTNARLRQENRELIATNNELVANNKELRQSMSEKDKIQKDAPEKVTGVTSAAQSTHEL